MVVGGCGGWRGFLLLSERGGLLRGDADEAVSAYRPPVESTGLGVRPLLQELVPTGGGTGPSRIGRSVAEHGDAPAAYGGGRLGPERFETDFEHLLVN